jgi:hypothetical protein
MKKSKFGAFDIILIVAIVVGVGLNVYGHSPRSGGGGDWGGSGGYGASPPQEAPGEDTGYGLQPEGPGAEAPGTGGQPEGGPGSEPGPEQGPGQGISFEGYTGYEDGDSMSIGDFFWYTEEVKWDGPPQDAVVLNDFSAVSGYWKAYTETIPLFEGEDESMEWFNAEISGDAGQASFTYHTKGFTGFEASTGEIYKLDFRDGERYGGSFNDCQLACGDRDTQGVEIRIYGFYSLDGKQYAIGEVIWISNELQALALVRP